MTPRGKVIPIRKIEAWSFSRYNDYKTCPAKAAYKHIDKLKEPASAPMMRGAAIHKLAEDYAKGAIPKLPKELELFKDEFKALKKQKVKFIEEPWTFKHDWALTSWSDWTGAWLRVKLDAAYINVEHNALVIIDHKTGKFNDSKNAEYEEQLQLYGLAGLKKHPTVDVVSPKLWYLDEGVEYPAETDIEFFRKDEPYLDKLWRDKVKPMLTDTTFKPTPGNGCRWCHFRKDNNGPCVY